MPLRVKCTSCNRELGESNLLTRCPYCGGLPVVEYDSLRFTVDYNKPGIWRYSSLLPRFNVSISRGEGLTPIYRVDGVLVKNERVNPTGNYTDRSSAVISSYVKSMGLNKLRIIYERGFAKSLLYYLSRSNVDMVFCVDDPLEVDSEELLELISKSNVSTCSGITNKEHVIVDYVGPLVVEGLKTIIFEIAESRLDVDYVVVPAKTGVLAYSLVKGLRELEESGLSLGYRIIAVFPRGVEIPSYLARAKNIEITRVSTNETLESLKFLASRDIYTAPLSAMGFHIAKSLGKAIAVLTMGYRSKTRRKKSTLRDRIVKTIERLGKATAYEIWRYNNEFSLRGVYKAIKALVEEGVLCEEPITRGSRKIMIYKLCD